MQPTCMQPSHAAKERASSPMPAAGTLRTSWKKKTLLSPSKPTSPQLSRSVSVTGEVERLPCAFSLEQLLSLIEGPSFTKYRTQTHTPTVSSHNSSSHSLLLSPSPRRSHPTMAVQTTTSEVVADIKDEATSQHPSDDVDPSSRTAY